MEGFGTTTEMAMKWFQYGEHHGQDWMFVIRNQKTCEEYPLYVSPNKNVKMEFKKWDEKPTKVLVIYDLSCPFSEQRDDWGTVVFG